jgi:hypothetical protein
MARARSFALNIMRKNGIANVAQALWNGALSLDHILAYRAIWSALNSPAPSPSRSSEHEKAAVDVDDRARDDGRALRNPDRSNTHKLPSESPWNTAPSNSFLRQVGVLLQAVPAFPGWE